MLYYREYILGQTLLGVWKITESKDDLLSFLDDHDHLDEILNIKSQTRVLEMLAVRVLLKELLGEEKKIYYLPSGKPLLEDHSYHISISHTKGYVTVALNKSSLVGLDIEYISDKILRVKNRIISVDEYIDSENEVLHLLLHWSAKEAMFKFLDTEGVDFREHLFVEKFPFAKEGVFSTRELRTPDKHIFKAHYKVDEDFVLVCLTLES